jgi:hypothetical protein
MAKVHEVKSARKANKAAGIKVGDSYYWWAFRFGGKRVSKTYPRRSQLTQSEFYSAVYDLEDRIGDMKIEDYATAEDLKSDLEDIASEIRQLGEEQDDKFNNMPEGLQQGDVGQLLEERRDACESWADELEAIDADEPDRAEIREALLHRARVRLGDVDLSESELSNLETLTNERYADMIHDALNSAIDEAQQAGSPS